MTTTGFVLVPLLFAHLPSAATAGFVAARLFAAQSSISIACAAAVLVLGRTRQPPAWATTAVFGLIITGLLLALLQQYGVAPRIIARQNLRLWHGLGTAMYALQWLCALMVLWRVTSGAAPAPAQP